MNVPLTPLRFKDRALGLYGRKLGVICGQARFTYAEFFNRCDRLARALQRLEVPPRARVAYLAFNCHRLLEAYYGVVQAGAVLLPLNFRLSKDELVFILNDSESLVLFFDSDFLPLVAAIRPYLKNVKHFISLDAAEGDGSSHCGSYERLLQDAGPGAFQPVQPDENDVAEIFYTSGTTARPKGVMLTHRNLYLHALSSIIALGIGDTDVQLHAIPLFHVNGWGSPQSLTCVGGTHVMMRRFDPSAALQLIQQERVTCTCLVPTMAHFLLDHPDLSNYDYSSLRMIVIGGAAPNPEMIKRIETAFGCDCYGGYGLTETSPILTVATPKGTVHNGSEGERIRRQSMTGWPLVGVDIRIIDEAGNDLPHDGRHVGEVIARGDSTMKGYWNNPEETANAIRGGWLFTGDMATMDEEGFVQIVDRKKDFIVSGGENIASIEVETCLYSHEAVFECAVVAVPDEKWGEVPAAFIVLKPGRAAGEDELIEFCRASLAPYKCPKVVKFLEALPKGGTGKVLKRVLREELSRQ
jgi:fatty-acyl-CoA synthase